MPPGARQLIFFCHKYWVVFVTSLERKSDTFFFQNQGEIWGWISPGQIAGNIDGVSMSQLIGTLRHLDSRFLLLDFLTKRNLQARAPPSRSPEIQVVVAQQLTSAGSWRPSWSRAISSGTAAIGKDFQGIADAKHLKNPIL
jgi:hypothetical protein